MIRLLTKLKRKIYIKSFNSYKPDELAAMIPGVKILKEEPLTHPKNCIIVWGANA